LNTSNHITHLPIFPLNLTVLPRDIIPLHIFEERYKKLISSSIKNKLPFGIVFKDKNTSFVDIGCLVKVNKVLKLYDDGRYDLTIKGENRIKILSSDKRNELWHSKVCVLEESYSEIDSTFFKSIHDKYLKLIMTIYKDINIESELNKKVSYDFTKNVLLPNDIKQYLIKLDNEHQRLVFINNFLDDMLKINKSNPSKSNFDLN
tara:strand:+ start:135 stop:746 length:612 start_codon:yes stop_codon:yes gene_type:complete